MTSSADDAARSARRSFLFALCIAATPYALLVARFDFLCDDAYISFRYVRHLAQGHGLVFNLGEAPPVEGYSNFLWVLWLTPFERLGLDIGWVARATSAACGLALIASTTRFAQRTFALGASATLLTALFAAVLPPITLWSTGGLESMAFALCTFACFERLSSASARRGVQAGALAAAAAWLRADGALWIGLVLACVALAWRRRRDPALVRAGATVLAMLVVAVAAHVGWRASYYGELLPNTARVKAGLSGMRLERGLDYMVSFFLAVPACAIVLIAAACARRSRGELATQQALLFFLGASLYAIYIGGDFMPMGRFLLPAMPFVVIAFAALARPLADAAGRTSRALQIVAAALVALALSSCFDGPFPPESWRERFHFRWNEPHAKSEVEMWRGMRERAEQWSLFGRALALHTQPSESIVLGNIGAIGYRSDIHIYDQFGLTSPEVARREAPLVRASPGHDKAVSADFFRDRQPTFRSAYIRRAGSPLDDVPVAGWGPATLAQPVDVESHPLRVEDGFAPGLELRLVRFRWNP